MKQGTNRHIYLGLFVLAVVIAVGTAGYVTIEGWSVADAFYMVILSVTTTGFQEVQPLSAQGRLLTTAIIITGLLSIGYLAGRVTQLFIETYFFRRRKMERKLRRIKDHYIVCGYGRMGYHICNDLHRADVPFVVVEQEAEQKPILDLLGYPYIIGNSSSDHVLQQAKISDARGLITVVSSDAENVFTTLSAKSLRPDIFVVARALDDEAASKLQKAGADRVVKPYEEVGHRLAQLLLKPGVAEFMDTIGQRDGHDISLEEIRVEPGSSVDGKTLRDLPLRSEFNAIVVAIHRDDGEFVYNPSSTAEITGGDRMIVIGESNSLTRLAIRFADGTASE